MTAAPDRITAAGTAFLQGGTGGLPPDWPLVCLHGIGGDATSFAAQIDGLAGPGRRVLSWDMPGYGGSAPLSEMGFGTLCDRLCAALDPLQPLSQLEHDLKISNNQDGCANSRLIHKFADSGG